MRLFSTFAAVSLALTQGIAAAELSGQTDVQTPFAQNSRSAAASGPTSTLFIKEYWVEGAKKLPRIDVEAAVYPFLGPDRTRDDVEKARAALEKAYQNLGFQTVAVEIPEQPEKQVSSGIIVLRVIERTVGRLRVRGAKYSSPKQIKAMAKSVSEGTVMNFNEVSPNMVALNQLPDRRITPSLRSGKDPDTVDVDLDVKETLPVHASVELNNRYGPDTDPLRLNATVSDNNLWQLGHAMSFSYQTSPQDPSEVSVFSGYYLARFTGSPGVSLMLQADKQDSNVSTLGDVAVAGRGDTIGARVLFDLPPGPDFTQSVNFGIDYKHFDQQLDLGSGAAGSVETPITYYPLSASYSATWQGKRRSTEVNAGLTLNLREVAGNQSEFANSRYNSDGGFVYFHGDISHTEELPLGFQAYGKVQGQLSDQPLVSGEEASGGGLGTVRGYLEAEVVGDNAAFGTVELRSPSLLKLTGFKQGDLRLYGFYDGGLVTLIDPLPGQTDRFYLASAGFGARMQLGGHFDGLFNVSFPQYSQADTKAGDIRVTFRAELDY